MKEIKKLKFIDKAKLGVKTGVFKGAELNMTLFFVLGPLLACCHPMEAQIGKRKLGLIFPIYKPVGVLKA